jgi:hypothetical protein
MLGWAIASGTTSLGSVRGAELRSLIADIFGWVIAHSFSTIGRTCLGGRSIAVGGDFANGVDSIDGREEVGKIVISKIFDDFARALESSTRSLIDTRSGGHVEEFLRGSPVLASDIVEGIQTAHSAAGILDSSKSGASSLSSVRIRARIVVDIRLSSSRIGGERSNIDLGIASQSLSIRSEKRASSSTAFGNGRARLIGLSERNFEAASIVGTVVASRSAQFRGTDGAQGLIVVTDIGVQVIARRSTEGGSFFSNSAGGRGESNGADN